MSGPDSLGSYKPNKSVDSLIPPESPNATSPDSISHASDIAALTAPTGPTDATPLATLDSAASSSVPSINAPEDKIIQNIPRRPERINLEDERLPGNVGWATGISNAIAKKWDEIDLQIKTRGPRKEAARAARSASIHRDSESQLTTRADEFTRREAYHTQRIARLNALSQRWKFIGMGLLTAPQQTYHGWRERINRNKASRVDKLAGRAGKAAAAEEKIHRSTTKDIDTRVHVVSERWQKKIIDVRAPRERIAADIEKITDLIYKNESLIENIKASAEALEKTKGGDRQVRRERLRSLHQRVAVEEAALIEKKNELLRKQKHETRLAAAHDTAEEAVEIFKKYGPSSSLETRDETPDVPNETARIGELMWSVRELAESKGTITNEQIGKLWNSMFTNAKLPGGYTSLVTLMKSAFSDRDVSEEPGDARTIKDFLDGMRELHRKSSEFRRITEQATGKRGGDAIATLIGRLETRIAFGDNLSTL